MRHFNDVRDYQEIWTKEYGFRFIVHYSPAGEFKKIINFYDGKQIYPESEPVKTKRGFRKVDKRSG